MQLLCEEGVHGSSYVMGVVCTIKHGKVLWHSINMVRGRVMGLCAPKCTTVQPPPKCGVNMPMLCGAPRHRHPRRPSSCHGSHFTHSRAACTPISAVGCPSEPI